MESRIFDLEITEIFFGDHVDCFGDHGDLLRRSWRFASEITEIFLEITEICLRDHGDFPWRSRRYALEITEICFGDRGDLLRRSRRFSLGDHGGLEFCGNRSLAGLVGLVTKPSRDCGWPRETVEAGREARRPAESCRIYRDSL